MISDVILLQYSSTEHHGFAELGYLNLFLWLRAGGYLSAVR